MFRTLATTVLLYSRKTYGGATPKPFGFSAEKAERLYFFLFACHESCAFGVVKQ
jgi:hypothetical protein